MAQALEVPFDSLESAHNFISLLSDVVTDAKRDIDADIQRELNVPVSRRLDAFRLAAYNLEKLEQHLSKSRRILNDLRSLRRLLFGERIAATVAAINPITKPETTKEAQAEAPLPPVSSTPLRRARPASSGSLAAA